MPENAVFKSAVLLIEDDSKVLRLQFGTRSVKPGEKVPKGEAQRNPKLGWNVTSEQKFIIISLDVDAPFPSFAPLSPVLHWLQAGFTATSDGELTSSDPAIAYWAGPGPPPISSPHRYIFLLYEQPADFDAKLFSKSSGFGIKDRMRWDVSKFEKQAKLGSAIAATYFLSN
ncbi:hypothetical protein H2200_004454 [Cladophialophora chaetospira]|uniref:Phosphatidylethanolamine-binding protein n=1 Tax=Cladophialophora chaetospira TaxID=386627 RepID=A0AA38XD54_9EURO|nr:hypothetical protein H2200_004454 [Cladophialophora chaetospira]